jgi:hypothetical protein
MSEHDMIERVDPGEAIRRLRQAVTKATLEAEAWRAWALELEKQMRREGWAQADFDAVWPNRPK